MRIFYQVQALLEDLDNNPEWQPTLYGSPNDGNNPTEQPEYTLEQAEAGLDKARSLWSNVKYRLVKIEVIEE